MDEFVSSAFPTRSGAARLRIEGSATWVGAVSVSPPSTDDDRPLVIFDGAGSAELRVTLETSSDGVSWNGSRDFVRVERG